MKEPPNFPDFNASWPLERALAAPNAYWRAFHVRLGARKMFSRRDDIGFLVGLHLLIEADKARSVARSASAGGGR